MKYIRCYNQSIILLSGLWFPSVNSSPGAVRGGEGEYPGSSSSFFRLLSSCRVCSLESVLPGFFRAVFLLQF